MQLETAVDVPLGRILPLMQTAIMSGTTYFGIKTLKCPIDAWIYQEIVFETRPDFIIELGNYHGGSALQFAHLCDAMGHGRVIGVDVSHRNVPDLVRGHQRITLIEGDACGSFAAVQEHVAAAPGRVLVVEDSSHTYENTLKVLKTYSPLLSVGDYFIVEDSICHHGVAVGPRPGPFEAIERFVARDSRFESDRSRERFVVTWNPKGYLRRVK